MTKTVIVVGDVPAKYIDGKEPNSNLTFSHIVAKSISIDPVAVIAVETQAGVFNSDHLLGIVESTGGSTESGSGDLILTLTDILHETAKKTYAWFGESTVGKIGEAIEFDANGLYDPYGATITLFEWDMRSVKSQLRHIPIPIRLRVMLFFVSRVMEAPHLHQRFLFAEARQIL